MACAFLAGSLHSSCSSNESRHACTGMMKLLPQLPCWRVSTDLEIEKGVAGATAHIPKTRTTCPKQ